MSDVFDSVLGDKRFAENLRSMALSDNLAQSYLFVGPADSAAMSAALAIASWAVCDNNACGVCESCKKVLRGVHPDVHVYEPEGASGYLIGQVRGIIADAQRSPIQAKRKVYLIKDADMLNASSANAFLKTLEEPPRDTMFVLFASSEQAMIPTIVSRCRIIGFSAMPMEEIVDAVCKKTGCSRTTAVVAYFQEVGNVDKAIRFIADVQRQNLRRQTIDLLGSLRTLSDWEIVKRCSRLVADTQKAAKELDAANEQALTQNKDFLTAAAAKELEIRAKRASSALKNDLYVGVAITVQNWLRDIVYSISRGQKSLLEDDKTSLICPDVGEEIADACMYLSLDDAVRAQALCGKIATALKYNVTPETCMDALFLELKEVLYDSGRSR